MLTGATLIDGLGGAPIGNAVVVINGERITAVGTAANVQLPDGAETIDLNNRWIVPGLIDAHAHFMESGRPYTKPAQIDLTHLVPYEREVAWMKARVPVTLKAYLCAGVTTVLSVGGPVFEYEVREQAAGSRLAPEVIVAHGPIALVPSELLFPLFDGDTPLRTLQDASGAAAEINLATARGADLIKIAVMGGPLAAFEADYSGVLAPVIARARAQNLPVTAHVTQLEAARTLIELGATSLQHLPLDAEVDAAFVSLARSKGTVIVPTLAVWPRSFVQPYSRDWQFTEIESRCGDSAVIQAWHTVEPLPPVDPQVGEFFRTGIAMAARNTRILYDAGVPLAAGSDAGNFAMLHGASLHYELQLMQNAGVDPLGLITVATFNAAILAGRETELGSISPGKRADLLVLRADPTTDIANLQQIDSVMRRGRLIAATELLPPPD
ncbi:MAG: amidohydrolase family protein [Pseudomonadales bacterium]